MKARTQQFERYRRRLKSMKRELTFPISWKKTRSRKSTWTGEQEDTSTNQRMKPLKKMSWKRKMK